MDTDFDAAHESFTFSAYRDLLQLTGLTAHAHRFDAETAARMQSYWQRRDLLTHPTNHEPSRSTAWSQICYHDLMKLAERIVSDPNTCSGHPRVEGTRIRVSHVLGWLTAGMSEAAILSDYPQLTLKTFGRA